MSLEPYFYDQMTSLFANAFPTDTLFRIWDLIFMEFSSPELKGKTQGICFIVAVSMFLIESAKGDILLADTPNELHEALYNISETSLSTEYAIQRILEIQ
jgi:hypothetical protein